MDVMNNKQFEQKDQGFIVTTLESFFNWGRARSLWPMSFGTACCAIEMMATACSRYDISRFGYEVFRASPRHADLMIFSGTITNKMMPVARRVYEQMPEPKWVVAMGSCAISGGPFVDSYNVVKGIETFVPVDVYIPGCPPRPEALLHGMLELKRKVQKTKKYARAK